MGSIFGGGAQQNNANNDQGAISGLTQNYFSNMWPAIATQIASGGTNTALNQAQQGFGSLSSPNVQNTNTRNAGTGLTNFNPQSNWVGNAQTYLSSTGSNTGAQPLTQQAGQQLGSFNANNNAFTSQGGNALGSFNAGSNPYTQQSGNALGNIANGSLGQGQIQSLSNAFADANSSNLASMKSQLGGIPNQNALFQNIGEQQGLANMQNTQALQSGLGNQEISAGSALGSLGTGVTGQNLTAASNLGSLGTTITGQNLNASNALGGLGTSISGLNNQAQLGAGSLGNTANQQSLGALGDLGNLGTTQTSNNLQALSGLGNIGSTQFNNILGALGAGNQGISALMGGLNANQDANQAQANQTQTSNQKLFGGLLSSLFGG